MNPIKDGEIKDGDILEYAREDSGMSIDSEDLFLVPGEPIVVGEDVDAEFGQRLVDLKVCRLQAASPAPADKAEKTATQQAASLQPESLQPETQAEPETQNPEAKDGTAGNPSS